MSPGDWYRERIAEWSTRHAALSARAPTISRWRLLTFVGGTALVIAAVRLRLMAPLVGAAAAFAAFAWLVVRHARILDAISRAEAGLQLNAEGIARLAREWSALPEVPRPTDLDWDHHPYAQDLDLYGPASLTRWLGSAATMVGTRRLADWLLAATAAQGLQRAPGSHGRTGGGAGVAGIAGHRRTAQRRGAR